MKRAIHLLLITIIFASCKKSFLETMPKGSLLATKVSDYDLLLNNKQLYDQSVGLPSLLLGDDVGAEQAIFQNQPARCQLAFRWAADWYQGSDVAVEFNLYTTNLYSCNKVINEVMKAEGDNDSIKKMLRAEALANRAYYTFQLAGFYTKPYNPSTAATDAGFPAITRAEINQSYQRGTVQQTYDFIIKDLTDAITDLPAKQRVYTRFSKPAAQCLLGKVYLFMGRYNDALSQFDAAMAGVPATEVSLYDYNTAFADGGAFLPVGLFGPLYPNSNNTDFKESLLVKINAGGSILGGGFGNDGLSLDPKMQSLYSASDLRLKLYSTTYFNGTSIPGGRLRKYGQQFVRTGVQLQDLYLLRAESRARTNDLTGAVQDVEYLRKNRMPVADAIIPSGIASDRTALIRLIIEERIREFAMEGYRWFDMRRLSVDPLFSTNNFTHTIFNSDGTNSTFTLPVERFVLRFPPAVMIQNQQMSNNP